MSMAFDRAAKYAAGMDIDTITDATLKDKNFVQGEYVVDAHRNRCKRDPELFGMNIKSSSETIFPRVKMMAKENGYRTVEKADRIFIMSPDGRRVGLVSDNFFLASTGELFEELGKLYNLSTNGVENVELLTQIY
jgi:hypothetical protein